MFIKLMERANTDVTGGLKFVQKHKEWTGGFKHNVKKRKCRQSTPNLHKCPPASTAAEGTTSAALI